MNLVSDLAREFIFERYPQHLPAFDEYIRLSALDEEAEEAPEGAKRFADFEFLEAMIGPFALGVLSGYFGNLLFYYLGPARFRRRKAVTEKDVEELRRRLKDADRRKRAIRRTCEEFGREELVEEIVKFAERRLRLDNDDQGQEHAQPVGPAEALEGPRCQAYPQASQPREGDHDNKAGMAEPDQMSRRDSSNSL